MDKSNKSPNVKKLPKNPHDIFLKEIIAKKEYIIEILSNILPPTFFNSLEIEKIHREHGSFIDGDKRELHTDALFSVPLKHGHNLQAYVLVEHKSQPDPKIHIQLTKYILRVIESQKKPRLVIPIVFYHGENKWNIPTSFLDTIAIPSKLKEVVKDIAFNVSYLCLDISLEAASKRYFSLEELRVRYVYHVSHMAF